MNLNFTIGRVSLREKTVFAKNLSVMLASGLDVSESLEILAAQAEGKMKLVVNDILKYILAGNSLAAGFALYPKIFSSFFIASIAAGETSGNLENNLKNISEQMEREAELMARIRSAMIYPLLVIALSLVIALVVSFVVLPKITPIFLGLKVDLPLSTRLLIGFSNFIKHHGTIFLLSLIGLAVFLTWLLRRKFTKPYAHFLILHLPIIRDLTINKNMASFCRSMGLLLASGLDIDDCLKISADTASNFYYKRNIDSIREKVSQGVRLSDNLAACGGYFPPMAIGMIRVGEKSGNLDSQLLNLSTIYQSEVDRATKNLSAILEPVLLIIIGLAVGVLALSIITPIYKITGNVYR